MQDIQPVKTQIPVDYEKIIEFCQRWQIAELALFGSVLREDFQPDSSDIDVLVVFADEVKNTIEDLLDMEDELKTIFGRDVDLVERRVIEQSRNYLRRQAILNSAKAIYATQELAIARLSRVEVLPLEVALKQPVQENPWTAFIGMFEGDAEFAQMAAQWQAERNQDADDAI
ncbi:nucleotidyltransferase family protein [Geitlerinema calcuttense]|uniref:nucleotidyltransferase family protein n=1 Tax=Geitlerinema calcuttense TaxID=1471433 RepID=UPI003D81BC51